MLHLKIQLYFNIIWHHIILRTNLNEHISNVFCAKIWWHNFASWLRNDVMVQYITHVLAASLEKRWFTLVRGDVKCFETRHWFVEIRTWPRWSCSVVLWAGSPRGAGLSEGWSVTPVSDTHSGCCNPRPEAARLGRNDSTVSRLGNCIQRLHNSTLTCDLTVLCRIVP